MTERNLAATDVPDVEPASVGNQKMRVAVICDYLEEQWPSMDLVGDMLCRHLVEDCGDQVAVQRIRPELRRRVSRIPWVPDGLARNADRLINRFADYRFFLRQTNAGYDLYHVVDHSYSQLVHALPSRSAIVTCHDLDTFRCLLTPPQAKRPLWFRAMTQVILDGFRKAAHVIAVSGATRDEIVRNRLFPPERISVIPNGVHPTCAAAPDPVADAAAAGLLSSGSAPVLLNVGSTQPRKRLDVLLRVFAGIRRELKEARLVRVGGFTHAQLQLAKDLDIEHAIVNLPFLERDILAAVYRRSDLLLHTAEAEGFGLPLVEAMACGCPVVASDIPVLREVGGEAVIYCGLMDTDAWTETVVRLLREKTQNAAAWESWRQQTIRHASQFSWAENARQTARVYRQVLDNL